MILLFLMDSKSYQEKKGKIMNRIVLTLARASS
jgi:hypothetical protein